MQNVKTFKDVKGCDDAKQELEEVVEYLKNPAKFTRLGGKLPKVCRKYFDILAQVIVTTISSFLNLDLHLTSAALYLGEKI